MLTLATFNREGFFSAIIQEDDLRCHFLADGDIDADGANGQAGKQAAYMVGDFGSEYLANGGMKMHRGRVVGDKAWFQHIVILGSDGEPKEFPGGVIASKTAYRRPGMGKNDPAAYVDSETVPYIVLPPVGRMRARGVVMGCLAKATNIRNGLSSFGVVADIGPRTKVGEVSIEMARRIGINPSPRSGGTNDPIIRYEYWPGVEADGFQLIAA